MKRMVFQGDKMVDVDGENDEVESELSEEDFNQANPDDQLVIMVSWKDLKAIWDKNQEKKSLWDSIRAFFNYHFNMSYYRKFADFGIDILNHSRINVDEYKKV